MFITLLVVSSLEEENDVVKARNMIPEKDSKVTLTMNSTLQRTIAMLFNATFFFTRAPKLYGEVSHLVGIIFSIP